MIRGTTDTFKFKFPCDCSEIQSVKIVLWQEGNSGPAENRPLPIVKTLECCIINHNDREMHVTLSQEETLRFSDRRKGKVQIRSQTNSGLCIGSKTTLFSVYPLYDDSILGDIILPTPDSEDIIILDGQYI